MSGLFDLPDAYKLDTNFDGKIDVAEEWFGCKLYEMDIKASRERAVASRPVYTPYTPSYSGGYSDTAAGVRVEVDFAGKEENDAICKGSYPNVRCLHATYILWCLKYGYYTFIPSTSSEEQEAEKCRFILSGSCIAAKYLTPENGFIFTQAVKENFDLPFSLDDEDEEPKHRFSHVFRQLVEKEPALAMDVWVWCIREFGPYMKYATEKLEINNLLLVNTDEYPEEFNNLLISNLLSDADFRRGLLTENPEKPWGIDFIIAHLLKKGEEKNAQTIFSAAISNPVLTTREKEELIRDIVSMCIEADELEAVECFKNSLLPIVKSIDDKVLQKTIAKLTKEIDEHVEWVEKTSDKYSYSRRFAWRSKYRNCENGVNPLYYETEQDYIEKVNEVKYLWRSWSRKGEQYGIYARDFETEEEYKVALNKKMYGQKEESQQSTAAKEPLSAEDMKPYDFCSVVFGTSSKMYCYLAGDLQLKTGDKVIVPVGDDKIETEATVVSVSQYMRKFAPFDVDKAKTIIRKLEN